MPPTCPSAGRAGLRLPRVPSLVLVLLGLGVAASHADTIHLANGDVLEGEVVERRDDVVVIEHESLGRIEVPAEGVIPERRDTGILGSGLLQGWKRSLQLGANGAEGNSDTLSALAGLDLNLENEERRWSIAGRIQYARDDGDDNTADAFLATTHDWLEEDRTWFPYVDARWDYDRFEDWQHRISAHTGIGAHLIEEDTFTLLGRFGPGVTRTFGSEDDRTVPELLLGLEGTWTISERQRVTFYTRFFPELVEIGEYRNLTGAAWIVEVDPRRGLSLKIGFDNRYESISTDDSAHNDLTYYGSLLLGF